MDKNIMHEKNFLVLNQKSLDLLNFEDRSELLRLLMLIKSDNTYWVVNKDEPYADEVFKLINEHESKNISE